MTNYPELAQVLGVQGAVYGEEYRARCPLHNDTHPSFSMRASSGRWICHSGCGQGEFTRLVELILGCSYQTAREWVKENGKQVAVEALSREINQMLEQGLNKEEAKPVQNWPRYYESLDPKLMPIWFLKRGLTWNTIQHWAIRYDAVQDCVVFPVRSEEGIQGIILRNAVKMPKYQNIGFEKSKLLFWERKPNDNVLILVEGVLDAVWLWQLGYNAASLLGHDLSRQQVQIIQKHRYGEVCLGLDNDEVGRKGTIAAVEQLRKSGYLLPQLSFLKYPPNRKDSQECTTEELEEAYQKRKDRTLELLIY